MSLNIRQKQAGVNYYLKAIRTAAHDQQTMLLTILSLYTRRCTAEDVEPAQRSCHIQQRSG